LNGRVPSSCHAGDRGSILILTLWVIFLLALLAVAVGAHIDGRLALARRMEQRTTGYFAARAGVERSLLILDRDTNNWDSLTEPWADSRADFSNGVAGAGVFSALYSHDLAGGGQVTNYGVMDEQSRIDLNAAKVELLAALLRETGGLEAEPAMKVASAMKTAGTRPPPGSPGLTADRCWVDSRLERGRFQSVEEVRWVWGMTDDLFEKIKNHVTVHGGCVNLNTADTMVLKALLARTGSGDRASLESLTRKILQFRQSGGIFKTYRGVGVVEALGPDARLTEGERSRLYALDPSSVRVASDHFRGQVVGAPSKTAGESRMIVFVWDRKHHKIEFWHED